MENIIFDEIDDYADVIPLTQFIQCVKDGGFIDYDGFGYYVKNGQQTNIMVVPSHVERGLIRYEFNEIVWFNR